jgi:hypothetical protein
MANQFEEGAHDRQPQSRQPGRVINSERPQVVTVKSQQRAFVCRRYCFKCPRSLLSVFCPSSGLFCPPPLQKKKMSVVSKARLPMRIIALPLTSSVRGPRHTGEPSPLVYYHFQMPPKAENKRTGLIDWTTGKATSIWAQFGKAPESSWKVSNLRVVSDHRLEGRIQSIRDIVQSIHVWREACGPG